MLLNCGDGEDSWESLDCKEIQPGLPKGNQSWIIHWKDWCWNWNSNTLATWCEELTHWKTPWCWERLKAGGEGDDRGWDIWMASPTQWTWVWASSRRWWRIGKRHAAVHGLDTTELGTTGQLNNDNSSPQMDLSWASMINRGRLRNLWTKHNV